MVFTEIKEYFTKENGINRLEYMSPEIGGIPRFIINSIFSIEKAINNEEVPKFDEESRNVLYSLLRNLVDKSLINSLNEEETKAVTALCELANNWLLLYEIRDDNINREIRILMLSINMSRTLEEQIELLRILNKKIYMIFMSEPIETRVSELYRKKIEDYFSITKHGEYRVE